MDPSPRPGPDARESAPFAPGSVSLRLYPHDDLPASALIDELCAQAVRAIDAGFDGVMTNEHHGGFPGYLPNPIQIAGFALAASDRGWAAPCPLLLPLRHWSHVAEELAWLAARHPGRVGAGFAVGGLDRDFELADLPWSERRVRFRTALPRVVAALTGRAEGPLGGDPAIAACADAPLPLVMAAQGEKAVALAARVGIGLVFDSLQPPDSIGLLAKAYRAQGGAGPCVLIRRVWLGPPPAAELASQTAFYRSYTGPRVQSTWGGDELVQADDASGLAEALAEAARRAGADVLNLRFHARGIAPPAVREQIEGVGRAVLPRLHARWTG
jgi:alkanesulfonate monooxygenase SsuD/methylene tetrahydromethanopterin reductase-like flavin-dependent oxidoreductase (luciferase family)